MKSSKKIILKTYIILCLSFIMIGCTPRSMNDPGVPLDVLKKKIILNGNKNAYEKLYFAYFDESGKEDFIYYSIVMANKYESPNGCYDVYYGLKFIYNNSLDDMSEDLRSIAIQFLKRAAELNSIRANEELGNLYIEGIYLPKDLLLGEKYIKNASDLEIKEKHWYYRIFN